MAGEVTVKSSGDLDTQSRKGRQTACACELIQALEDHRHLEYVDWTKMDFLAPMGIEQVVLIEGDIPADQSPEGGVGPRLDSHECSTDNRWHVVCFEGHAGDDPKGSSTAALERPEEVRVLACIDDTNGAIGSDDFRLQQAAGGRTVILREVSEPSALNEFLRPRRSRSRRPGRNDPPLPSPLRKHASKSLLLRC